MSQKQLSKNINLCYTTLYMSGKKLKIDDSINIETHSHIKYDASGEQRRQDEKFYVREKSMLETGAIYFIIAVGTLIGIFIYFRIQSYDTKKQNAMIEAYEKQAQNKKQKSSCISEINALRNSISEIKSTEVVKYSSTEIGESENMILKAEMELKKFNFSKVTELTKKIKDKLDEASDKAKRVMDQNKEKELAEQKKREEKRRLEKEKQKQAEKKRKEIERQKQRKDALKKLQEIENMIKR
ncbi:MAG: hypothetical protein ABII25_09500 [bacterium]